MEDNNYNFIAFGCWNYLNDSNDSNEIRNQDSNLKHVTDLLEQTLVTNPNKIKNVFVLGDNYYPFKDKDKTKPKTILSEKLNQGFDMLKRSVKDIPITMILGNHDLDNITIDSNSVLVLL
jgi:hypothetical protein